MVQFHQKKNMKVAACLILFFVCLFSLPLRSVKDIHAHTSAQRNGLEPHQVAVSRERYLRAAAAHVNRANQLGYAYNRVLNGTSYVPLMTSTQGFCCVDLVTHVVYTAMASQIDGRYHSIAETMATAHTFASSNGLVFNTQTVSTLGSQLSQMPKLYQALGAGVSPSALKLGDIVLTGNSNSSALNHSVLVLGKITSAENAYMNIPKHDPDKVYFISMSSTSLASYRDSSWLNRPWYNDDPTKGYFIKQVYRPLYSIASQDLGGFRFKKASTTNGQGLSGAIFKLEGPGGFSKTITMNSAEYSSGKTLPPGSYTLREISAPPGCKLDSNPRTVEIAMDETNSVYWNDPILNAPNEGYVQVIKRDADSGVTVEGAVFELSQSSSFPSGRTFRMTTGVEGMTAPQTFDAGDGSTVYVREVSVPAPYTLDPDVKSQTLIAERTITFEFYNHKARGKIEIIKKDETGNPIQGASFQLLNNQNAVVTTLTTNQQGRAEVSGLALGTHYLKEISVPAPYLLDDSLKTIKLNYKNMHTPLVVESLSIENETAQGRIRLIKKDAISQELLAGAVFHIFNDQAQPVDVLTTDASGEALSTLLPLGSYTVKEVTAPSGFVPNNKVHTIQLSYQGMHTAVVESRLEVENEPIQGKLLIIKFETDTAKPIEGVCFELYDEQDEPARDLYGRVVGTLVSDEDGLVTTPLLRAGQYTLREQSAPEAYWLCEKDLEVIITEHNKTVTAYVGNERILIRLKINKRDQETGEPLQGATFQIIDETGEVVVFTDNHDGKLITVDRITTNEEGDAFSAGALPAGCYYIREINSPKGYASAEDVVFTVNRDTRFIQIDYWGKTSEIIIDNTPIVVELLKKDELSDEVLAGAQLRLVESETEAVIDEWLSTKEPHRVKGLESGTRYSLQELNPPKGYALSSDVEFTVMDTGEIQSFVMYNRPTRLEIQKTDEKTGNGLPGVKFEINLLDDEEPLAFVFNEDRAIYAWADSTGSSASPLLVSDQEGLISVRGLPVGDYELHEIEGLPGYARRQTPTEFSVTFHSDEEDPVVIVLANKQTEVILKKRDSITSMLVAGSKVAVYNDQDTLLFEETTDQDGNILLIGLPAGQYCFEELVAPPGYLRDCHLHHFSIDEYGFVHGVTQFFNQPTEVTVRKIDAKVPELGLEGAVFELYPYHDQGAEAIMTDLVTDKDGHLQLLALPFGSYRLVERKAPPGYAVDRGEHIFDISEANPSVQLECENHKMVVQLIKMDETTKEPLEGATICLWSSTGEIVGVTNTDSYGLAKFQGLMAGDYCFTEQSAPPGYVLSDERFFVTLDEYGNIKGDCELTNRPTRLIIEKVDQDDGQKKLAGVSFEIFSYEDQHEPNRLCFNLAEGVYTLDANGSVTTLVTDSEGVIDVRKLPPGDYMLKETKALDGYEGSEEKLPFRMNGQKGEKKIVIQNRESTTPTPLTGESKKHMGVVFLALAAFLLIVIITRKKLDRRGECRLQSGRRSTRLK
ncbi:MAG: SpaA isopeptide-forming pilin-related protein [Clostridiales bacterium]|nr:SpaA isopeptide-forming pilin-related protein [Clostridiales bacterium]MDD3418458.1 SpaA isopeptide-forming pilin-related protein [Eubacteriales bacterium]HZK28767.1 SpaA isopeptide-forming pilin-related protein [Clostridia bacterium]